MKTREQAEARAYQLYPRIWQSVDGNYTVHKQQQAYLQCWDDMQEDNQTCGFCVEPKQEEEKPQPQERVEKLKNDYLRGEYELDEFIEKLNTAQNK